MAEQGCNIENIQSREKDGMTSTLDFIISVHGRGHLARVMRRLRQIPIVMRIQRILR
jgi:GTP diphosphokinase / guanosine-3',5'-bis(diphosphate) 3'-diphosphatase